jgi:hypothetical protein
LLFSTDALLSTVLLQFKKNWGGKEKGMDTINVVVLKSLAKIKSQMYTK